MRLVIFDFDGTIHLKETPRIFLRVLNQDRGMRNKIIQFYTSVAWVYFLYRFGLCHQLMMKRVLSGITKIMRGMSQIKSKIISASVQKWQEKTLVPFLLNG